MLGITKFFSDAGHLVPGLDEFSNQINNSIDAAKKNPNLNPPQAPSKNILTSLGAFWRKIKPKWKLGGSLILAVLLFWKELLKFLNNLIELLKGSLPVE